MIYRLPGYEYRIAAAAPVAVLDIHMEFTIRLIWLDARYNFMTTRLITIILPLFSY